MYVLTGSVGTPEKSPSRSPSSLRFFCVFERTAMLKSRTNRYLGKIGLSKFLRSAVIFVRTAAHISLFTEIYPLFISFDPIFRTSIIGYLLEAPHFCPCKMRPDHASGFLFLAYFISSLNQVFTSEVESNGSNFTWDNRGYVFYCPCMGM